MGRKRTGELTGHQHLRVGELSHLIPRRGQKPLLGFGLRFQAVEKPALAQEDRPHLLERERLRPELRIAEEARPRTLERRKHPRAARGRLWAVKFEREIDLGHHGAKRKGLVPLRGEHREGGEHEKAQDKRQEEGDEPGHRADRALGRRQHIRRHDPLERHPEKARGECDQRDDNRPVERMHWSPRSVGRPCSRISRAGWRPGRARDQGRDFRLVDDAVSS